MKHRINRLFAAVAFALVLAASALGCGPVESLVVINQANLAIEAASRSDAPRLAPYEYYMAVECVHKAREEMNYSDFEVAIDLALEAREKATKAREKAITHPERTHIPPVGSSDVMTH